MQIEEIEKRVKQVIADIFNITISEIKNESKLSDFGSDSLDQFETVMFIEDEFNIRISDEYADINTTVQNFIDIVYSAVKS